MKYKVKTLERMVEAAKAHSHFEGWLEAEIRAHVIEYYITLQEELDGYTNRDGVIIYKLDPNGDLDGETGSILSLWYDEVSEEKQQPIKDTNPIQIKIFNSLYVNVLEDSVNEFLKKQKDNIIFIDLKCSNNMVTLIYKEN